jgi:hypothetical protein
VRPTLKDLLLWWVMLIAVGAVVGAWAGVVSVVAAGALLGLLAKLTPSLRVWA